MLLRRISNENIVSALHGHITRKAGTEASRIAKLAIIELHVTPTAGRGVLGSVLDHELNVGRFSSDEGLRLTKNVVVLLGGDVLPG
jgi:hypothetical protein